MWYLSFYYIAIWSCFWNQFLQNGRLRAVLRRQPLWPEWTIFERSLQKNITKNAKFRRLFSTNCSGYFFGKIWQRFIPTSVDDVLKRFSRLKHFTYRIVGGQEAKIGKYPWLANLGFQLAGKGNVEFKVRLRYDDCMAGLQYSRIGFDQTGD